MNDEKLTKLRRQIELMDGLKRTENWGPEFQLWKKATGDLVRDLFGEDGLKLLQGQDTVAFSYISDEYNQSQYTKELDNKRKILEGLLANASEHQSEAVQGQSDPDILKEIWRNEEALKENLLMTDEAEKLQKDLIAHLESELPERSIPGLRLRKIKAEKKHLTWWSNEQGYPFENPWGKIEPFLRLLEQHEAGKTIKHRLETEGLFVETRAKDEDLHLLVGSTAGAGAKAHIIIDGETGELRVEANQQEPLELVKKIEAVLTLPSGVKIKTTREAVEEIVG